MRPLKTRRRMAARAGSKRPADQEPGKGTKKKPKPLEQVSKFGGMSEEEVCKMLLPDHLKPGLDIVFIGINPGLYSAYLGHHYCNANNHFWPCLHESGLVPKKLTYREDAEALDYGIGLTNIVPRTTRGANELSRKEIREWSKVMIERMKELRPLIACFNGKGIYELFSGKKCEVGLQQDPLPDTDTVVYVMPSTSGRAATYPRRVDKLKFFNEVKQLRDSLQQRTQEDPGGNVIARCAAVLARSTDQTGGQGPPSRAGGGAGVETTTAGQQAPAVGVLQSEGNESGTNSVSSTCTHDGVTPNVAP